MLQQACNTRDWRRGSIYLLSCGHHLRRKFPGSILRRYTAGVSLSKVLDYYPFWMIKASSCIIHWFHSRQKGNPCNTGRNAKPSHWLRVGLGPATVRSSERLRPSPARRTPPTPTLQGLARRPRSGHVKNTPSAPTVLSIKLGTEEPKRWGVQRQPPTVTRARGSPLHEGKKNIKTPRLDVFTRKKNRVKHRAQRVQPYSINIHRDEEAWPETSRPNCCWLWPWEKKQTITSSYTVTLYAKVGDRSTCLRQTVFILSIAVLPSLVIRDLQSTSLLSLPAPFISIGYWRSDSTCPLVSGIRRAHYSVSLIHWLMNEELNLIKGYWECMVSITPPSPPHLWINHVTSLHRSARGAADLEQAGFHCNVQAPL